MKSLACFLLALGVCAGAFGAHGIKGLVTPERLEVFKTASQYQIMLSIFLFVLAEQEIKPWILKLLSFGIVVFSFSLYFLVIFDMPKLGIVTPIGGISIIVSIFIAALRFYKKPEPKG